MACCYLDCWYKKLKNLRKKHTQLQSININDIDQVRNALQQLEATFYPWAKEYDRRVLGKNISSGLEQEDDDNVLSKRKEWLKIKAISAHYGQHMIFL